MKLRFAIAFCLLSCLASAAPSEAPSIDALLDGDAASLRWKERLGLTPGQSRRFAAAELAREEALAPLREKRRSALIKLGTMLAENAPEGEVKAALSALGALRESARAASEKSDAVLSSFLSPSQLARLALWRAAPAGRVSAAAAEPGEDLDEPFEREHR